MSLPTHLAVSKPGVRRFASALALTFALVASALTVQPAAAAAHPAPAPGIPAHIDLTTAKRAVGPNLASPLTSCTWYTITESIRSNKGLTMDVSLLGMYDTNGHYCGRASDHVCGTPSNTSYQGGLIIANWWYANGVAHYATYAIFYPYPGQTVCSYSGGFNASNAVANGQFNQGVDISNTNEVGIVSVETSF
jgi:hypothetical protein